MRIITTSWDDGHPLDMRIADLLHKYHLQGTFYIPKYIDGQPILAESDIRRLSNDFETGSHTLHHVWLTQQNQGRWEEELVGSRQWLQEVTGVQPVSFCFPGGAYTAGSLAAVYNSGYQLARTTELLNISEPSSPLLATSLQVYEHSNFTYAKHLAKRSKWQKLADKMLVNTETDLLKLTELFIRQIENEGGCFHLWGHSWEIEKFGLWEKLEALFQLLSGRNNFQYLQNRELLVQSRNNESTGSS